MILRWDTPPDQVRLKTDAEVSISWPFGDDVAEVMSTLNDEYFEVFLDKAWSLCREHATAMSPSRRKAFLDEQRKRLDGYRDARRRR